MLLPRHASHIVDRATTTPTGHPPLPSTRQDSAQAGQTGPLPPFCGYSAGRPEPPLVHRHARCAPRASPRKSHVKPSHSFFLPEPSRSLSAAVVVPTHAPALAADSPPSFVRAKRF